jgi:uncharacterized membrane protein YphA (DoxX/SURF4 family)
MNAVPSIPCTPDTPSFIARVLDNSVTLLLARIAVTLPFLVGGFSKLFDWHGGEQEMLHVGLHPAWARVWLGAGALGQQLVAT